MRILIFAICMIVMFIGGGLFVANRVFSQEAPDTDQDGWSDGYEFHIGTSPASHCIPYQNDGLDAWPPDFNRDGYADISDIAALARWFGSDVNGIPYYYRYDIWPEPI